MAKTFGQLTIRSVPWAFLSLAALKKHALERGAITHTVSPRPDVATRVWHRLEWTGADGEKHCVEASSQHLLLERATVAEMEAIARENARWQEGTTR